MFRAFPAPARPLLDYHEVLMRGPSPLTVAERELIAACVSGLNSCHYCHEIHAATAEAFGVGEGTLTALAGRRRHRTGGRAAEPLLRYIAKLTTAPSKVTTADVDAMRDAGWDDRAVYDAASVCALFNLMNRLVDGLGVTAGPEYIAQSAGRLADGGYAGLKPLLEEPR